MNFNNDPKPQTAEEAAAAKDAAPKEPKAAAEPKGPLTEADVRRIVRAEMGKSTAAAAKDAGAGWAHDAQHSSSKEREDAQRVRDEAAGFDIKPPVPDSEEPVTPDNQTDVEPARPQDVAP